MSTLTRIQTVLRQVFRDDELVVGPSTTAKDVDGWDSLNHVRVVVAVEKEFGLRFGYDELQGLDTLGAFEALIDRKLSAVNKA